MTPFIAALIVFVLAVFIGFEVIAKVPSTLHTPLMSGSNAISGITIVGAMMASFADAPWNLGVILGAVAVALATINVVGGYLVTDRMLGMFAGGGGGGGGEGAKGRRGSGAEGRANSP